MDINAFVIQWMKIWGGHMGLLFFMARKPLVGQDLLFTEALTVKLTRHATPHHAR